VFAQEPTEIEQMRQQLEGVEREGAALRRALRVLEQRLREVEATQMAPAPPPAPTAPPPAKPVEAPPPAPEAAQPESEEVKKKAPPSRAVEAVFQEEHALFGERRFTFEPALTYSRFDRTQLQLSGFLALDAIFLGSISVDEIESDIVTLDLTFRYSPTDWLQVRAGVPWIYRETNFQSGGAGGAASVVAEESVSTGPDIGDVRFGLSYRLLPETLSRPDVVVNLDVRAPTGQEPFGIEVVEVPGTQGNLSVPEDLPTGNGIWQVSSGLSFLKTVDPVILFANFTYFHNFDQNFDDISSDPGDQPGEVALGDSWEYGLGLAFALNERTSLSFSYSHRFINETKTKFKGDSFAKVIGSDANVAVLNVGVTYALTDRMTLVVNVGAGLTDDAADVQSTVRLPITF